MNGNKCIVNAEFKRISEVYPKIVEHVSENGVGGKPGFYPCLFVTKTFYIKYKFKTIMDSNYKNDGIE